MASPQVASGGSIAPEASVVAWAACVGVEAERAGIRILDSSLAAAVAGAVVDTSVDLAWLRHSWAVGNTAGKAFQLVAGLRGALGLRSWDKERLENKSVRIRHSMVSITFSTHSGTCQPS